MKGTWKEDIGGYNSKDTKRKRQSRKNTLKDSLQGLLSASFRNDKKVKNYKEAPTIINTQVEWVNGMRINEKAIIYLAKIRYKKDYRPHKEGFRDYEEKDIKVWIPQSEQRRNQKYAMVYNTGEDILQHVGLEYFYKTKAKVNSVSYYELLREFDVTVEFIKEIDYITWDLSNEELFKKKEIEVYHGPYRKKVYVYGKRVPYEIPFWQRKYSGKFAKKMGSRIIRKKFKQAIKKEKYEDCVKEEYYRGYHWI